MNDFVGYIDDQGRVFDGTFDYEGHVGPIGPQGVPGYTPQRGVDYWTDEDKTYVVAEATSLINGKIEEYNANATAKTNAFNQNASDKTDAFNSNATSKTTSFNNNASDKTTAFNSNATNKTNDYNDNATSKTTAFDTHVDEVFDELTGNFYTKSQTYSKDEIDGKIASTYHYKGSVEDYTQLPSSGQQVGDVWNIEQAGGGYNAGDNVAWTGSAWDILAGTVDLSSYYTKSQADALLGGKQNVIDSSNKLASDLVDDTNQNNKFVTSQEKENWNNKSDFSGDYNDLTNKPDLTIYEEKTDAETKYETLLDQIPTATATGNPINVQDSSNLPIKGFTLKGNSSGTVTGDVTVNVLWKNLFNKNNINANKGVNTSNGGLYNNTNAFATFYIPITTTTYYCNGLSNSSYIYGALYDNNKNFLEAISTQYNSNKNSFTIINNNAKFMRLQFLNEYLDNLQIEKGSTATSYEPYTEQTQPLSLGDIQLAPTDEISKVNNEWCVNETPITDTTLKGQLENILQMHTNKNVTNISIVPTGTNAEPTAEVEYRQDLQTVIGNIQTAILSL